MHFQKKSYHWSGISKQGEKITGEIKAPSLNLARLYIVQLGVTVLSIQKKRYLFLKPLREKIHTKEITLFFRQLATLIQAGLPIVQCFMLISSSQENKTLQTLINTIKMNIESGKGLSFSFQQFPHYFDSMSYHLVHMGEQTGKLDKILLRIAQQKEKNAALKKQLQNALLYPAVITCVAFSVLAIMLIFVVPRFADLFQSMHGTLPAFTQSILNLSLFIQKDYWLSVFPVLIFIFLKIQLKRSPAFQKERDKLILQIPFLGKILKKVLLTRFSKNLALTLAAGIPMIEALKIIAPTLQNDLFENAILRLQLLVSGGQPLGQAMRQLNLFPQLMIKLTEAGAESGQMEQMQEKIASIYETELDQLVSQQSALLEPLIITILGVLIGSVVIALYLPIFKLGTVI